MCGCEVVESLGVVVPGVHLQEVRWFGLLEELVDAAEEAFHHHAASCHEEGAEDQDGHQGRVDTPVPFQIVAGVPQVQTVFHARLQTPGISRDIHVRTMW